MQMVLRTQGNGYETNDTEKVKFCTQTEANMWDLGNGITSTAVAYKLAQLGAYSKALGWLVRNTGRV